ncbi:MAG: SPOR domain-containing protein [Myxococcales bacterium]
MRDLDRWKDKVELSLDGRQIFFLFFGSAVAACLVFVLGVLVGKRLEARALAMTPAPVEDPLAALDQLGEADDADEGLTFHKALTHDGVPVKKPVAEKMEKQPDLPVLVAPLPLPPPGPIVASKPVIVNGNANGNGNANANGNGNGNGNANANANANANVAANAKPVVKPAPAPLPPGKPQVVAAAPKKPEVPGKKPDATGAHFTLQLSAFPEKSDAEEFMKKIQTAGYKPFLVASEIPGKGIFYRVRVGDYASRQAAVDAKTEFERKQRMIAYVAKL